MILEPETLQSDCFSLHPKNETLLHMNLSKFPNTSLLLTSEAIFKVPVRSNFPKFKVVDFSKVYVAVTYQAKPFFNPSSRSPFFPRYFSIFASAIDRPCSYRAVGGMGPVTSYS